MKGRGTVKKKKQRSRIGYRVAAGVMEMVARGVFGLCLVPYLGFDAVCFASPAAWIMADAFLFPAYFYCMKKRGYNPKRRPKTSAVKVKT